MADLALKLIAIDIPPAPLLPHEAAAFVQACRASTLLAAGDKLYLCMVGVQLAVRAYFQAKPLDGRLESNICGASADMPSGKQVVAAAKHEGAVA